LPSSYNGITSSYPSGQVPGQAIFQQNQNTSNLANNSSLNKPTQTQSINNNTVDKSGISTLTVRTVDNSKSTTVGALSSTRLPSVSDSNVTMIVQNVYTTPDGYSSAYHYARGSPDGVTFNLKPGSFTVSEIGNRGKSFTDTNHITNQPYSLSFSGDCHTNNANVKSLHPIANTPNSIYGMGTLRLGETKSCVIIHIPTTTSR
jgi:hypothetical protein